MYFFLDTTLPDKQVITHYLGLVAVLLAFYAAISAVSAGLELAFREGMQVTAGLALAGAVAMVCKVKD